MAKQTKKQSRKELLKEEDAFLAAANKSADWATENRGLVIGGLVAIFVVIAAAIMASSYLREEAESASGAYAEAMRIQSAQLVGADDADPSAEPPTFADEKSRAEAAVGAFAPLRSNDGVGAMATFYHAAMNETLGNTDAALKEFEGLLRATQPTDPVYFLAIERVAFARERSGDLDGAMTAWGKLANSTAFYSDRAALNRARLLEKKGDAAKARELYEGFEESFPESSVAEEVKTRLAALGTPSPKAAPAAEPAKMEAAEEKKDDVAALEAGEGAQATP